MKWNLSRASAGARTSRRTLKSRSVAESTGGQSLLNSVRTGLDLDGLKWKKPWKSVQNNKRIPSVITAVIEQAISDTRSFDHNADIVDKIVREQINTSDYEVASIISKELQERTKLFSSCLCHKVDEMMDNYLNACKVEVVDDNTVFSPPSNMRIREEWLTSNAVKKNRNRLRMKSKKHKEKGRNKSNSDLHSTGSDEGEDGDPDDNKNSNVDDTYVVFVFNGEPDLTSYKNLKSVDVADLKHNTTRSIAIIDNHDDAANDVNKIIGAVEIVTDDASTSECSNVEATLEEKIMPNSHSNFISDIHCVQKKKSKSYYYLLARKRSEYRKAWKLSSG